MKNRSLPRVFFGLALIIGILWVFIEVALRTPRAKFETACRTESRLDAYLGKHRLISSGLANFWAQELNSDELVKYFVRRNEADTKLELIESYKLRCQTPGYNCFMPPNKEGFSNLKIFFKSDDFILVQAQLKNITRVFPMRILDHRLVLGRPVKICGQAPLPDPSLYGFYMGNLFYRADAKAKMAQWKMGSFENVTNRDPGLEPDFLYSLQSEGLRRTTCNEPDVSFPSEFKIGKNHLLARIEASSDSAFFDYLIEPALTPNPQGSKSIAKGDRLISLSNSRSRILNMKNNSSFLLEDVRETYKTAEIKPEIPQLGRMHFEASPTEEWIFGMDSSPVLSPIYRWILYRNEKLFELPSGSRKLWRSSLDNTLLVPDQNGRISIAETDENDIFLRAITCDLNSDLKSLEK